MLYNVFWHVEIRLPNPVQSHLKHAYGQFSDIKFHLSQRPGPYCKTCRNKFESPPPPTDQTRAITAQCQDFGVFRPGVGRSSAGSVTCSPASEHSPRLRDRPGLIIQRGREVKRSRSAAEDLSAFLINFTWCLEPSSKWLPIARRRLGQVWY